MEEPWSGGGAVVAPLAVADVVAWGRGDALRSFGLVAVICFARPPALRFGFVGLASGCAGMIMPGMFIGADCASAGPAAPTRAAAIKGGNKRSSLHARHGIHRRELLNVGHAAFECSPGDRR